MNISLPVAAAKKNKSQPLNYGLNSNRNRKYSKQQQAPVNVFGDDDDDDDDDDLGNNENHKKRVNRQIRKEQEALRERAKRAALGSGSSGGDVAIYDYDSFVDKKETDDAKRRATTTMEAPGTARKSKYIQDLLQAADQRRREREVVLERKIAREIQAEEEEQVEYRGKEKFITSAYKRKLEERSQWQTCEQDRQQDEETNDVTKKTAGAAFATFYGNLKNIGGGGNNDDSKEEREKKITDTKGNTGDDNDDNLAEFRKGGGGMAFLKGFERSDGYGNEWSAPFTMHEDSKDEKKGRGFLSNEGGGTNNKDKGKVDMNNQKMSIRERREKKVAETRMRFLERKKQSLQ